MDRYTDHLFHNILVPLSGETESWQALEQAIIVAQKESASLDGIHITLPKVAVDEEKEAVIQAHFNKRCLESGLSGGLAVEKGAVADLVCQRALLADLIVLNVAHPPSPGLSSLASGIRSIIWHSSRPIMTVPARISPLDKALVAFDGSKKSKEAVFVAAYLAERWQTALTVLTLADDQSPNLQNYAREYFALHELEADYIQLSGPQETFLDVIREREINLVVMGGYSGNAWQEVIIGSMVNFMLRNAECPLLICR